MAKKSMNFKSAAAEKRWAAYGSMHGDFAKSPGNTPVKIQGRTHKVQHGSTTGHKGSSKGGK
jgi:hypothetical protein